MKDPVDRPLSLFSCWCSSLAMTSFLSTSRSAIGLLVRMTDKRVLNVRSAMYAPEGDNVATADLTLALLQAGADARGQLGAFGPRSLKDNGSRIIQTRVIESSDLRSPHFCMVSVDSLGQPVHTLVVVKKVARGSLGLYLTRELFRRRGKLFRFQGSAGGRWPIDRQRDIGAPSG